MKKRKSLNKKIQRLKVRLEKDAKKLAKLTRKLGAAGMAGIATGKRKSVARAGKAKKPAKTSALTKRKKRGLTPKASVKPVAAVQRPNSAPKVKKKLNLTPERRAQLAAAMKARWDAKRAAAAADTQSALRNQGFSPGGGSQPS